jgi:FAD/FMN-containing dehydrogenase/Fe-S oxidoreductase
MRHENGTNRHTAGHPSVSLEQDLRRFVRGEVRFDDGTRALYATDSSNYRQVPIGVVFPCDTADALGALEVCRAHGAPVLPRGAGTSLAGQCCNVAVIVDCSRHLSKVLEVDPARRLARVEPGVVLDDLRRRAEAHHLTFGPDPATHRVCTLGGMIGNNSCGVHSVMAGKTEDNVLALDVITAEGVRFTAEPTSPDALARILAEGGPRADIYRGLVALRDRHAEEIRRRFPDIPRRVSGYNLAALLPENGFDLARALVGSEGTCVFLLEATVKLVESPPGRCVVAVGFEDIYAAADRVPSILPYGPIGLEGFDDGLVEAERRAGLYADSLALLPEGRGWLLVELGGATPLEAEDSARRFAEEIARGGSVTARVFPATADQHRLWRIREAGLGATSHAPGEPLTWEGWEDSAVHPRDLGKYLRDLRALLNRHGFGGHFYGHFGQACVHTRTNFDLQSAEGIRRYRAFVSEAADLVVSYGGSLSGEHGDGQSRAELLPKMYGDTLVGAFREFKRIFDPRGRMNPGKVVDARPLDSDLRLGAAYAPARPATHFAYADDGGDFSRAMLRCVGVGACRRNEGGTMCPSWRATAEEKHSTRGRARLLFEMLRGETISGGWRDERVREALDLCLACKGCRGECPAAVDMATYKAEFLSHYYEGRLRPRSAYALNLIPIWAPIAGKVPAIANFFTQTPGVAAVAKWAAGISPERRIPRFATRSFRSLFSSDHPITRSPDHPIGAKRRLVLWPDTFSNFFQPRVATAAATVLTDAGFSIAVPAEGLCCGRPFYDAGFLDLAREYLVRILDSLRDEIRAGTPIVVLEPSCASVFKDELVNLFPRDPDARRLAAQTRLFAEFLETEAPEWAPSVRLSGRSALVQGHCHQQALGTMDAEASLLERTGLSVRVLDAGCCGMAGAFGFESSHHGVSTEIARLALEPALEAAPGALVIADGFSCREQIRQTSGREALHVAEALLLRSTEEHVDAVDRPVVDERD